jgi:hypothetical protein
MPTSSPFQREQRPLRVRVRADLDARHHAGGRAQLVAADREAVDEHLGVARRQAPEPDRARALEEARVVDGEQRGLGVVVDVEHARRVLLRVAPLERLHVQVVRDDVRVREDAVAVDDARRAAGGVLPRQLPRVIEVRLLDDGEQLDDGAAQLVGLGFGHVRNRSV